MSILKVKNHFGESGGDDSHSGEKAINIRHIPVLMKDQKQTGHVVIPKIRDIQAVEEAPPEDTYGGPDYDMAVPHPTPLPPLDFSLVDHELEQYRTSGITKMQSEIKQLRSAEMAALESEKRRILNDAYQEGKRQGAEENEAFMKQKSQEFLSAINEISTAKASFLDSAKHDIARLAVKIAERIIGTVLDKNPEAYMTIVDDALGRITDKDRVILRVNPEDALILRDRKEELDRHLSDIRNFSIQEDHSLSRGGCVVETKMGYIDASIRTKLDLIEKALYGS